MSHPENLDVPVALPGSGAPSQQRPSEMIGSPEPACEARSSLPWKNRSSNEYCELLESMYWRR